MAFNASAQAIGLAVSSAAGLAAVAILARYLGTADYGVFLTATAFVSLFQLVSDLGIEPVSIRRLAREPEHRGSLLSTILVVGTGTNVIAGVASVLIAMLIYAGEPDLVGAVAILATQSLFGGARLAASATGNSRQRAYLLSLANTLARLSTLAFTVVVVAEDWGLLGAVVAQAAYLPLRTMIMVFFMRRDFAGLKSTSTGASADLLRLAAPMAVVATISYIYFRLDLLLLSFLKDAEEVALYGIAYKAIEVLSAFPGFILVAVLPVLSREEQASERFMAVLGQSLRIMQCLAGGVLGMAILSTEIVTVLGGKEYASAGATMALLLAALSVTYLQQVFGFGLVALGQQQRAMLRSLIVLAANLAMNLALIPLLGALGAAIALLLSEVISLMLFAALLSVRTKSLLPSGRLALALVVYCVTTGAVATFCRTQEWPDVVTVAAALLIGGTVYAATLIRTGVLPLAVIRGMGSGRLA